ncbi:MAG: D-tyrosyl-tRNA(Tyr) deacylase, partial [Aeromicrobium sp.]
MRAVIQRAFGASVSVDGEIIGSFDGSGLVILLGVTHSDSTDTATALAQKIAHLR